MKRVGIAGFGVVGKRRSDFIQKIPDLELTAVCDQTFKGAGFLENGVAYCRDYRELIKQKLDILFVCLPNYLAHRGGLLTGVTGRLNMRSLAGLAARLLTQFI